MRKEVLVFLFLFLIFNISAICNEGQININTASAEDLDKITQIGPAKASSIINSRPFNSVDDLLNVSGIGEITLDKIKAQNLACVSDGDFLERNPTMAKNEENADDEEKEVQNKEEKEEIANKKDETAEDKEEKIYENQEIENKPIVIKEDKPESIQREVIVLENLDTKDIKSEKNKEKLNKNNYAIYGLVGFVILLLFLFIIKNYKLVKKNEFK